MAISDWELGLTALASGFVGAAGGGLLTLRRMRDRATTDYRNLSDQLRDERIDRVRCEKLAHERGVLLARHGIEVPDG